MLRRGEDFVVKRMVMVIFLEFVHYRELPELTLFVARD